MQRFAAVGSTLSICALVGCFGNPAILGVGEESVGEGDGDSGDDGPGNDGFSDTGTPGDDGADTAADTGAASSCADIDAFGTTMAATLTPSQYDATVRDLTGAAGPFAVGQIDATRLGPFAIAMDIDEAAALAPAVADAVDLDALLPCDPATTDASAQQACFDAFVPGFARLAWRRPVTAADLDAQAAAFAGAGDFATNMRAVIASVLADDDFIVLARTGTPTPGDEALVVLDAHALATRLAMFLWNSGPDGTLLDLADSGALLDAEVLNAQAQRLLDDVRAARMVDDFTAQWIDIADVASQAKDPELFPEYDAALAADMLRGTQAFARSVVLGSSGRLADQLTMPSSFANADLAAIYGVDIVGAVPAGSTLEPVTLDPAHRGGLLTEPSFATMHSNDDSVGCSKRGKVISENLLCRVIAPPPPDVDMDAGDSCAAHIADPACAACHAVVDPFSGAFANYDPIGRWTDEVDGVPVDPSGETSGFTFANRTELVDQMLASELLAECTVAQYLRYALDRLEGEDDECTLETLAQAFVESDENVRALALEIVASDAFRVARLPS
ncbi:MAG TPA: DUF1592 domain-containing protein [Nannocystaceae bacterium]|nr:DUF1592 domain-containing protein [Nannocystaceae bacterium]